MQSDSLGAETIGRHGHLLSLIPKNLEHYGNWLNEMMSIPGDNILVVDVRDTLSASELNSVRGQNRCVVLLDDLSDRRFAADLAFYPPVPQVARADWAGFHGKRFTGWEWVILRRQFAESVRRDHREAASVLITMGGSDPAGLTMQAVEGLELAKEKFDGTIVLGSGFRHKNALNSLLEKARRHYSVHEEVQDMRGMMSKADIALCSYGMTAFELAATGVPAIYFCLSEDHAQSASALADAGAGISLGVFNKITGETISETVTALLASQKLQHQISEAACRLIDGQGASRIANLIAKRIMTK